MNKDTMMGLDTTVPNSARIWNYWLGGQDNYPIDREVGEQYRKIYPGIAANARAYRDFLARAVRYLADEAGLRQFLDIGTGLPTADNIHEIAQRIAPESRIVYVDNDPLVIAYARALLASVPEGATAYVDADVRDPHMILHAAATTLDLDRPIAVILSGILGHVGDAEKPHSIVNRLMDNLSPGSYLVAQDGTTMNEASVSALRFYNRSGAMPYHLRAPEQIIRFFDDLVLLEPGVVPIRLWRPDITNLAPADVNGFGGVGRKA
jgi:O-methyltransferase involved in polyketide biosynthesis